MVVSAEEDRLIERLQAVDDLRTGAHKGELAWMPLQHWRGSARATVHQFNADGLLFPVRVPRRAPHQTDTCHYGEMLDPTVLFAPLRNLVVPLNECEHECSAPVSRIAAVPKPLRVWDLPVAAGR